MSDKLEQRLLALGTALDVPAAPDVVPAALVRLPARRRRHRRPAGRVLAIAIAATLQAASLGADRARRRIAAASAATLRRAAAILTASLAMAGSLALLVPLAATLLGPEHSFAIRFAALMLICAAGAAVFGACGLALGAVDRAALAGLLRAKAAPAPPGQA